MLVLLGFGYINDYQFLETRSASSVRRTTRAGRPRIKLRSFRGMLGCVEWKTQDATDRTVVDGVCLQILELLSLYS